MTRGTGASSMRLACAAATLCACNAVLGLDKRTLTDGGNDVTAGGVTTGADSPGTPGGSGDESAESGGGVRVGTSTMDSSGSSNSGIFNGAAAASGGGYDARPGTDDAAAVDSWTNASDVSLAESGSSTDTGLSVLYKVEVPAAISDYLGCQLLVKNSGTGSPAVSTLKVRYYFTDEVHLTPQLKINWSHISTSGPDTDLTVTDILASLVPAAPGADTYIEFGFSSGHPMLGPGESAVFSWQMQGPDPAKNLYTQTNDYSFDPSKTTLASWAHVVLLQNGSIVWGMAP